MNKNDLNTPNNKLTELMKNPASANVSDVINLLKGQEAPQVSFFSPQNSPPIQDPPAPKKDVFSLMTNLFIQSTPPETFKSKDYNLFA